MVLGIPTSSTIVRFLLVALTGVVVSQVIIPLLFPHFTDGYKWLATIVVSLVMWFLSGMWVSRVRTEGRLRERYS